MSFWTRLGIVFGLVWVLLGALSLLPIWEIAPQGEASKGDSVILIERPEKGLAEAVEPGIDFYEWAVEPAVSSAHSNFPRYCGDESRALPNHTYFVFRRWWGSGGKHWHSGVMEHAIGADYSFKFQCGYTDSNGRRHHAPRWP